MSRRVWVAAESEHDLGQGAEERGSLIRVELGERAFCQVGSLLLDDRLSPRPRGSATVARLGRRFRAVGGQKPGGLHALG